MTLNLSYGEVEINKVKGKEFFVNFGKLIILIGYLDIVTFFDKSISDEERGAKLINTLIEKVVTLTDSYDEAMICINNVLGGLIELDKLEIEDIILIVKSIFDLYDFKNIMSLISKKK